MDTPDYEIHLDRRKFNSLWDTDDDGGMPFSEDLEDIDRLIAEELGSPKRRKKPRRTV